MPDETPQHPAQQRQEPKKHTWPRIVDRIKRKFYERRAKKKEEKPQDRAARRTANATVWIAIFTVILALVGFKTLVEVVGGGSDTHELAVQAKNQADKMKDISDAAAKIQQAARDMSAQEKRLADDTEKSLKASNAQSREALNASINAAHLEQRAWVGAIAFPSPRDLSVGQKASFGVIVANTGKTPAINVSTRMGAIFLPAGQAFIPTYPPMVATPSISVIAPGVQPSLWTPSEEKTNTDTSIKQLKDGTVVIYVFGEITYNDIFNKIHRTHFCGWLQSSLSQYASCAAYNDAN